MGHDTSPSSLHMILGWWVTKNNNNFDHCDEGSLSLLLVVSPFDSSTYDSIDIDDVNKSS
eukprot:scaffold2308_cov164-Ochromonas_danica.AAC.7